MKQEQEKMFFELTNPQKSILMSENFYGNPHIFVIPAWTNMYTDINYEILEQAINYTVKNHDIHRVRFIRMGEDVVQYFENYTPFDVPKITINDTDELEDYLKNVTFDIFGGQMIKFLMYENATTGVGGFACVLHHLIGDAWSLSLIAEETMIAYAELLKSGTTDNCRISFYKDFIDSEAEYLESEKYIKDKEFWENKFSESSDIFSFKSNSSFFETSSTRKIFPVQENLIKYCKENKISLFSFFFAAYSLYFSRIINSDEVILGTPFLNRTNRAERNSMGMFISTLPFKQNINNEQTIEEFIKEISITQLGLLRHQKYPFAELQKYYSEQFGRKNNLYDILFSFQNARIAPEGIGFEIDSHWVYTEHQVESLVINVTDVNNTDSLYISYDFLNSIFTEKEIVQLNARIMHIANQMMLTPKALLKNVEIVTPSEKDKLLKDFNHTFASFDTNNTIATLVSKIAKECPDDIAIIFNNDQLTYKQLDEKSNYLASELINFGIEKNTFVGVLFNRSLEMIVSILAILKAGAAYMPINPDYPKDRIDYMINDSDCKFILASEDIKYEKEGITKIIFKVDELDTKESFENINSPHDLAYIIYTSGSTGKPKGVMIEHHSIINTLYWRCHEYKFDKDVTVLQIPSFAFDSSVEDIFTPLISGSKLVLVDQSNSNFDLNLIRNLIIKHNANHMLVVPSFYNVLLNEMSEVLENFKYITVAGEGFSIELVKKHFELLPNVELYNEYGPTENSVCTSFYKFNKDDDTVYIGRPISNCKCYILNKALQLQPFNAKGELYVSGPGLARGYIGVKELNETRFIKNPFEKNTLMYKTGDIVSINENGLMMFHERADYQVKYNGYRINLGEIENTISVHTKIPNVVVLLKDNVINSVLAAYIETAEELDIQNLKQELKKFLPHYMIPKEFNLVEKFPMTPNGKIDRNALEKTYFKQKDAIITAPRNELDTKIMNAWKKILKQDNFGIDDNIFDLGGDSLSIISIQSILFKDNVKVNSQALFENPTIRSISDYISSESNIVVHNNKDFISPIGYTENDITKKFTMPKNIFLTGVTGFLGAHVLAELLNKFADTKIYCLIRNKPNKTNLKRLKEVLHFYFGAKYDLLINDRIVIVSGDLSRENMGMDITEYKELTTKIDSIIHCASLVKHFGDYNTFYNSNVVSAQNIIKFAKESKASINHVSTTSVSGNYLVKNSIKYDYTENDFYIGQNYKDNVYVRTKFEAEEEMLKAQSEGIDVNIFRVGNLMPRITDGVFQINRLDNAYFKRILGFAKLRKLPQNLLTQELEFTPIDSCAEALVKLMVYKNKVFHLLNKNMIKITQLISELLNYNINVEFISEKEFDDFIHNDDNSNYLENFITDLNNSNSLDYDTTITINTELTELFLEENGFKWPKISDEYLKMLVKNLLEETNDESKEETK